MKSNVLHKPTTKGATPVQDTTLVALDRFGIKLNEYKDIAQWMRKNLTQDELDHLRDGACAFHPQEGLADATKEVVLKFRKTFAVACEGSDGHYLNEWEERIADDPKEADIWSSWTTAEREAALLISDVMADYADYYDVNVSACADLIDDPDALEEYLVEWMQSKDQTLVEHAHKVADMAEVDLNELI